LKFKPKELVGVDIVRSFKVAVLGATGVVGHRFSTLLAQHPWFRLSLLTGSAQSAGKPYGEVVWCGRDCVPESLRELEVEDTTLEVLRKHDVDIVFSALPAEKALGFELELARSGLVVVSNASPLRLEKDVPLVNPEANADHILHLTKVQQRNRGWQGFIVKVPNCTTAILTLALKPLLDEFGLKRVIVSTMQAVSGAGAKGVPSLEIIDNIIPYIEGEEEKVEKEAPKILGAPENGWIRPADIVVSASCHRVPVLEGHLEAVFVELSKKAGIDEVVDALKSFKTNKLKGLKLPTAPAQPIIVKDDPLRPQPRLDREADRGMSVVVGRVRRDPALENGIKLVLLGNNLVRGAAGTGVLIAEFIATYWSDLMEAV